MTAPVSELPQLTDAQRAEVQKFSFDETEYKRLRVLLRQYATERQTRQGSELGRLIESFLAPLGRSYALWSVSRRGTPLGWRITIRHEAKGTFEFQCLLDDVDALTFGRLSQAEVNAFRARLFAELGEQTALEAAS